MTDIRRFGRVLAVSVLLVSCGGSGGGGMGGAAGGAAGDSGLAGSGGASTGSAALDPSKFLAPGLVREATVEECTLSGGTATECYRITVTSKPSEHDAGPFCPRNISDGPEVSGVWFEGGVLYDADGAFIENLASFYADSNWQLFDASTGDINVTDTQTACEAAARPDVAEEYQNHCVECDIAYYPDTPSTYVLPMVPVESDVPSELGRNLVGAAFNGVNFDPPAPTDAILAAYTIAALDDCGGHVNAATGYHYHAATGCTSAEEQTDGHASMLGYALDAYGIYALSGADDEEPSDLDACRGHSDDVRGYHYHVASPGENLFIGCFNGEYGCHFEGDVDTACDASADAGQGPPGMGG